MKNRFRLVMLARGEGRLRARWWLCLVRFRGWELRLAGRGSLFRGLFRRLTTRLPSQPRPPSSRPFSFPLPPHSSPPSPRSSSPPSLPPSQRVLSPPSPRCSHPLPSQHSNSSPRSITNRLDKLQRCFRTLLHINVSYHPR